MTEFTCAECGRDVVVLCGPSDRILCGTCLFVPGWFRDAAIRKVIDPDHDGREVCER